MFPVLRCLFSGLQIAALGVLLLSTDGVAQEQPTNAPILKVADYAQLRAEIRKALFIPATLPSPTGRSFGSFSPAKGVVAERVTYATLYGLRVPAIVYRPATAAAHRPGLVIVNGHGGDKTSWYAFYAGILYAQAGAVVVTYDPIGEDERNIDRKSAARSHDTVVPGDQMPARLGGLMIADVMQAVSYLAQRPDVDASRIGVAAFSMGTFHSVIAGALDARIRALVLSGGGNLSGDGDYWDTSPKVMCQSGPYKALRFLDTRGRGPMIYALNQQRGTTYIINGTADPLIVKPHSDEVFFAGLRDRNAAISGARERLFETAWIEGAGHRPNFVTLPAALWLEEQLHFPNWSAEKIRAMPEVRISDWAKASGIGSGPSFADGPGEGGMLALDAHVPYVPRTVLQAVPDAEWLATKKDFIWETWVKRATAASN